MRKITIISILVIIVFFGVSYQVTHSQDNFDVHKKIKDIDQDIELRKQLGLNLDEEFITSLHMEEINNDSIHLYGIPLTNEELLELQFREKVVEEALKIRNVLQSQYSDIYGGMYMDHENGGIVNFYIVNLTKNGERISSLFNNFSHPERIKLINAKYSYKELLDYQEKLDQYWIENNLPIKYTSLSERDNQIDVGILYEDRNILSTEKDILSNDKINIHLLDKHERTYESRQTYTRPLIGGLAIKREGSGNPYDCTLAFSVIKGSTYYIITAAHCGLYNSTWSQGNVEIGQLSARSYGPNSDAAAIRISSGNQSGYLYGTTGGQQNRFSQLESTNNDEYEGQIVCMSGATTDVISCGTLYKRNHTDFHGFQRMRLATYSSMPGDSGAPVYRNTDVSYRKMIAGVHSGRETYNGTNYALYSHASWVKYDLDIPTIILQQ